MSALSCPNCGHRLTLTLQIQRPIPSDRFLERVSRAIERRPDGMTRRHVRANFKEDKSGAKAALDELLRLGYVARVQQGASFRYRTLKPYRDGGSQS